MNRIVTITSLTISLVVIGGIIVHDAYRLGRASAFKETERDIRNMVNEFEEKFNKKLDISGC